LKELMVAGRCEIGTHLHPWVSPPYEEQVNAHNSYTGNLPARLEFEKLQRLTEAIKVNFERQPTVFKAGRYGLGTGTANALVRLGYKIDASIVPHSSFGADGGPDFSEYDNDPFWFGPSESPLLELPVTTGFCGWLQSSGPSLYPKLASPIARRLKLGGIAARSRALERIRLSPEGCDAAGLIRLTTALVGAGHQVFTLTYHSPSLVPGHTPYVRTNRELDAFLGAIDEVCAHFQNELGGIFMSTSKIHETLIRHHR
jgi:hypothetical protein